MLHSSQIRPSSVGNVAAPYSQG